MSHLRVLRVLRVIHHKEVKVRRDHPLKVTKEVKGHEVEQEELVIQLKVIEVVRVMLIQDHKAPQGIVIKDHKDREVQQDQQVIKVISHLRDLKVLKDRQVMTGQKVIEDQQVLMVQKVIKVQKVIRVTKGLQVIHLKGLKDLSDHLLRVQVVQRDLHLKDHRVIKALKVLKVLSVIQLKVI